MRNDIRIAAMILAVLTISASASAQDHLIPEESIYADATYEGYGALVATVFKDAYAPDVQARVIVNAPFQPIYVLGVKLSKAGDYSVFGLGVRAVNGEDPLSDPLNDPSKKDAVTVAAQIKLDPCNRSIGRALGENLVALWNKALLQTSYEGASQERVITDEHGKQVKVVTITADATTHHFAQPGDPTMEGQTTADDKTSRMGRLVDISDTMGRYCLRKNPVTEADLASRVSSLLADMQTEEKQ